MREILERIRLHELTASERDVPDHVFVDSGGPEKMCRDPDAREEVGVTTDKSGRTSAGILLWRRREGRLEVLLAHQGGPLWVKKDIGHWTIPKGEVEPGEEFVAVARREFAEETGVEAPNEPLIDLGQITQKSGKLVLGWAVEGDLDASTAVSNTYEMEWPPHSGVVRTFPEIDRVEWFDLDEARRRLKPAQVPFLERLQAALASTRTQSSAHAVDGASRDQRDGEA